MFRIRPNNEMILTRGDTAAIYMEEINGYRIKDTDNAVFVLKEQKTDENPIFTKKVYPTGFIIEPSDTEYLPLGRYWYEIKVTTKEGFVRTLISSFIIIKRGLTYNGKEEDEE